MKGRVAMNALRGTLVFLISISINTALLGQQFVINIYPKMSFVNHNVGEKSHLRCVVGDFVSTERDFCTVFDEKSFKFSDVRYGQKDCKAKDWPLKMEVNGQECFTCPVDFVEKLSLKQSSVCINYLDENPKTVPLPDSFAKKIINFLNYPQGLSTTPPTEIYKKRFPFRRLGERNNSQILGIGDPVVFHSKTDKESDERLLAYGLSLGFDFVLLQLAFYAPPIKQWFSYLHISKLADIVAAFDNCNFARLEID